MKETPMSVETVSHAIRSEAVDHNEGLELIRGLIDRAIDKDRGELFKALVRAEDWRKHFEKKKEEETVTL